MRKKGSSWMTEETGKIIISILVIIVLIFFVVSISSVFLKSTKEAQAKATLTLLTKTIKDLPEGSEKNFIVESPVDWFLWTNTSLLCFFPKSCLEALPGRPDWVWSDAFVTKLQIYPACISSGVCSYNLNIDIPHDQIYYSREQGLMGQIFYATWFLRGASGNTMYVNFFKSLMIDKAMTLIKLRKVNGKVDLIAIAKENLDQISILSSLVDQLNAVASASHPKAIFQFNKADGKYLIVANNDKMVCLCDKYYEKANLKECDAKGLCTQASLPIILVGEGTKNYLEITSNSDQLLIEKVGSTAPSITISNPKIS